MKSRRLQKAWKGNSGFSEASFCLVRAEGKDGGALLLEAELYRLRGEALLAGAATVSEAETAIEKGIDVARRQNANELQPTDRRSGLIRSHMLTGSTRGTEHAEAPKSIAS
jgi:hypothetical protein